MPGCHGGRGASRAAADRLLDVGGDDAAAWAGAGNARQVDAVFTGEPAGQRRDVACRRMSWPGRSCASACGPRRRDRDFRKQSSCAPQIAVAGAGSQLARERTHERPVPASCSRVGAAQLAGGGRARRRPALAGDDRDHRADRRVSPACTLISVSVPAVIDGTSIDTLSVSISNRLSPGFTASPADLNHLVILPSATVSPSCGIRTSIASFRVTSSPRCIASPGTPSALRARPRGRCRTASCRRTARPDRRRARG